MDQEILAALFFSHLESIFSICTVIFIHASMRLRNIKNKVANKMEMIGLKRTPMGLFLDALGQEQV